MINAFLSVLPIPQLRNIQILMGLQRYLPFGVLHYVVHDQGHHFIANAPFRLQVQNTIVAYLGRLLLGKDEIVLVVHDHFQLICFFIDVAYGEFVLFWGKTDPIPASR